jgi:hypothetical protein
MCSVNSLRIGVQVTDSCEHVQKLQVQQTKGGAAAADSCQDRKECLASYRERALSEPSGGDWPRVAALRSGH